MILLEDIHPLTDFQRNARKHLTKANKSGRPQVLTVNGKAQAVLIGTKTYERMMAAYEEAETIASIRRGLKDVEEGRLIPMEKAHAMLMRL